MFDAIYNADVLIADITGANPNVFFELGVRFGLRKSVTVITTQDEKVPFDLLGERLIRYANRRDETALEEIVRTVCQGLDNTTHVDSPIIRNLDLHVLPREQWERVAGIRIKTLLEKAADESTSTRQRLDLVIQAVKDDPFSIEARLALARLYRERQDYSTGIEVIDESLQYFPKSWQIFRERGLILDKMQGAEHLPEAIETYRHALELESGNADLHCCLGGSLRRFALINSGSKRDDLLEQSLKHYSEAIALQRYDTYAGLNTLRLLLLMGQNMDTSKVASHIQRMFHLCAFEVADSGLNQTDKRWWKLFDFGDTQLFSRDPSKALMTYQDAVALIPDHQRSDTLKSPLRSWNELIEAEVMDSEMREGADQIISLLRAASEMPPLALS